MVLRGVETDIKTFTASKSVCGLSESLIVMAVLPNRPVRVCLVLKFPSMPVSEQRRPGSVKAHGKAKAGALMQQDVAEKGTLCVRPLVAVSPPGLSRETGRRADGPMGNARGFDPMADAHNTGIVQPDLLHVKTQLCFHPQCLCLSLFFCLCLYLTEKGIFNSRRLEIIQATVLKMNILSWKVF